MKKRDAETRKSEGRIPVKAFNISETAHRLLADAYSVELPAERSATGTGHLVVGKLVRQGVSDDGVRCFEFRWDNSDNSMDVDPVGCSKEDKRRSKDGWDGYEGHHAMKKLGDGRVFNSRIVWKGTTIYDGDIAFNLAREVESVVSIRMSVSAKVN